MHWGKEYNAGKQNREQKEIANYLSSLGVDIILGHHPHVLQPYERIDNTLVFYSLGNFLSYQNSNDINRKVGVIMSLNITKNKNKIHISEPTFELTYCYKNDSNYEIIPFSIMNNTILNNYKIIQKDQLSYLL
jgi:poly-gamma-glutamate synthesis protein (capsule biosynthesis protein)